ncbi:hypothetical protein [Rhizobium laguerreae]|uniref:Uncharacterized protein n=1 Tax=Rhizobium laguerreae TaxID=1076926 RepID=A0A6N9ZHW0_9HYPH|nr:hypothetical protein [Rhizobium laguerreae]NEH93023.1 hypothetical protein [Rhizobium laguerreae]
MSLLNEGAEASFDIVSAAIAKTSDARLEQVRTVGALSHQNSPLYGTESQKDLHS